MITEDKTNEILNVIAVITALQKAEKARKINNPISANTKGRKVSYNVECLCCGKFVRKKSHNAKYCSDDCKITFFRDKKRAIHFIENEDAASILSYLEHSILTDLSLLKG